MAESRHIELSVNGERHHIDASPETPLLYVLRDQLGLLGTRFGCGQRTCGACMVIVDGKAVTSCDMAVEAADGCRVETVESLGPESEPKHRLARAVLDEQAAQCSYCLPGILMSAKALLDENPAPTEADIRAALNGNLCRCGSHVRILRAIVVAAAEGTT